MPAEEMGSLQSGSLSSEFAVGFLMSQYDGTMSISARGKAIETFRDTSEILIMVASLKCGGVGLNLTMASRVICVDLWWNNSVEQQGIGATTA